jgi:hypothetical protein
MTAACYRDTTERNHAAETVLSHPRRLLAIPSAFVRTLWSGLGLPSQGGAPHCLNDLDWAGPTRSAPPGRRLSGWRHHPRAPERPAGGPVCVCEFSEAPELPSTMAARGFLACRAAGGAGTAGVPPALAPGRRGSPSGDPLGRPLVGGASGLRSGPP